MSKFIYQSIFDNSHEVGTSWSACDRISWQEAEDLINFCKDISPEHLSKMGSMTDKLAYFDSNSEWDSDDTRLFPMLVCQELLAAGYASNESPTTEKVNSALLAIQNEVESSNSDAYRESIITDRVAELITLVGNKSYFFTGDDITDIVFALNTIEESAEDQEYWESLAIDFE